MSARLSTSLTTAADKTVAQIAADPALTGAYVTQGSFVANVKDAAYGAKGDGSSDDTTSIQAAINACNSVGGGRVYFPRGTYRTGQITLYSNVSLIGAGYNASILRALSTISGAMLKGYQFEALTGTNSPGGITAFTIEDLTIRGANASASAGGQCLQIYGYAFRLHNLRIFDASAENVYIEHGNAEPGSVPFETTLDNIWVHSGVKENIIWNGPTDARWHNVVCFTPTTGYHNVHIKSQGQGLQASDCHTYGAQADWAWYVEANACNFVNCEGEGATVGQVFFGSQQCAWIGGRVFAPASKATVGFQIGDATHASASANRILSEAQGFSGGAIYFGNDGSRNHVDIIGVDCDPMLAGAPTPNSTVYLRSAHSTDANSAAGAALVRVTPEVFTSAVQVTGGGLTTSRLYSQTVAPTVTATNPTSGTTSYLYKIVSVSAANADLSPSPASVAVVNAAALSGTSSNYIHWGGPAQSATAAQKLIVSTDGGTTWLLVAWLSGGAYQYTDIAGGISSYTPSSTTSVSAGASFDGSVTTSNVGIFNVGGTANNAPQFNMTGAMTSAPSVGTNVGVGRDNNSAVFASGAGGFYAMTGATKGNILDDGSQNLVAKGAVKVSNAVSLRSGTGIPTNTLGIDGDLYIRSDGASGATLYQRRLGSYSAIA